MDPSVIEERLQTGLGRINEIMGDHKVPWFDGRFHGPDGPNGKYAGHMAGDERLDVPPMVYPMWREIGLLPVAMDEEQLMGPKVGRMHDDLAVWCIHPDFLRVFHQVRHLMSTENPDFHGWYLGQEMFICLKRYLS